MGHLKELQVLPTRVARDARFACWVCACSTWLDEGLISKPFR
ncbi:hypothetical protein QTH97_26020 [Variovorax sp. J22R24]|nr:hypothetical protein [Variovorax sp. J22R24]MDM0108432.1 hypothetical protein [Variovorax sp. J22R24]